MRFANKEAYNKFVQKYGKDAAAGGRPGFNKARELGQSKPAPMQRAKPLSADRAQIDTMQKSLEFQKQLQRFLSGQNTAPQAAAAGGRPGGVGTTGFKSGKGAVDSGVLRGGPAGGFGDKPSAPPSFRNSKIAAAKARSQPQPGGRLTTDRASRVNDTPPKPLGSVAKIAGMIKGMAGIARKPMGGTGGSKTGIGTILTPGQGRLIKQLTPGQGRSIKQLTPGQGRSLKGLGSTVKGIASTGKSVGKSLGGVGRGIARAFKFEKGGMATTSKVGKAVKRKTADVKGRAIKGK